MHKYKINLKLHTLAKCDPYPDKIPNSFCLKNITFEHWGNPLWGGQDAWIISTTVEAKNFDEAQNVFGNTLHDLIPKISLISQCYTEYLNQPLLIHKEGSEIAFFQSSRHCREVGLSFEKEQLEALELLSKNKHEIPNEFFYYWNDMINATNYSAKLLLAFAAIDALTRKKGQRKKEQEILKEVILGKELKDKFFKDRGQGIRQKLSHGEYYGTLLEHAEKEDYLEQAYKKIISYFNTQIFNKELIIENVRRPQRHFFGNYEMAVQFIRKIGSVDKTDFVFKELMDTWQEKGIVRSGKYEFVASEEVPDDY